MVGLPATGDVDAAVGHKVVAGVIGRENHLVRAVEACLGLIGHAVQQGGRDVDTRGAGAAVEVQGAVGGSHETDLGRLGHGAVGGGKVVLAEPGGLSGGGGVVHHHILRYGALAVEDHAALELDGGTGISDVVNGIGAGGAGVNHIIELVGAAGLGGEGILLDVAAGQLHILGILLAGIVVGQGAVPGNALENDGQVAGHGPGDDLLVSGGEIAGLEADGAVAAGGVGDIVGTLGRVDDADPAGQVCLLLAVVCAMRGEGEVNGSGFLAVGAVGLEIDLIQADLALSGVDIAVLGAGDLLAVAVIEGAAAGTEGHIFQRAFGVFIGPEIFKGAESKDTSSPMSP